MLKPHSPRAQAAYHDLCRLLMDDAASEIIGTPQRLTRNGKGYWYDLHRIGSAVKNRYLGEDSPEMAARMARHAQLATQTTARTDEKLRLVRTLRAEGLASIDRTTGSLMLGMERAGVFRLGGTIIGTQAFRLYEAELGIRLSETDLTQTGDIDIAQFEQLSLALGDKVEENLADTFKSLDFDPVPGIRSTSVWKWRQTTSTALVEFLTPSFRAEEDIRPLPALGVAAQSLHFLNFLIAEPIKAAALYRSGVLVQIPRPEAYAIHKLIIANRRKGADQLKSRKDRAQAALLIEALAEDRPEELREAHEDALSRGPQWRAHIESTLKRMPDTAAKLAAL
ncbi:MAG: hypothetical protein EON48_01485 [Acetobacteraceae bacterium]|nr:MAG: hypothetical protein EON48_01485 [Acetobacteraceae bacterium]